MAISRVSRHQKQAHTGQELRQADQTQVEGAMGDFVDLPADRHRLHLEPQHDEEAGRLVEREVGIGEHSLTGQDCIGVPHCLHCAITPGF